MAKRSIDYVAEYAKHGSHKKAAVANGMAESTFRVNYNKVATKSGTASAVGAKFDIDTTGDRKTISSKSTTVKTVEDAIAKAELDMSEWRVVRSKVNSWEVGTKDDEGKVTVTQLWQVTVWVEKIQPDTDLATFRKNLLEQVRKHKPKLKPPRYKRTGDLLFEPSIYDHHFGKLCWAKETGENYDVKIASELYAKAVGVLIERASRERIGRVLFPVGHDILHVDNANNTTHKGTPQDVDGRWPHAYLAARRSVVDAIMMLREVAPVDVVVVSGNHDTERAFYLGDAIECYFNSDKHVNVDNRPMQRKYYPFGRSLIGLTHGNEEKATELPMLMADEAPHLFAAADYHEWHIGHWHQSKKIDWYKSVDTHGRAVVRYLPSLSGKDAYHNSKGYRAPRASEGFLWDKTDSLVGTVNWTPLLDQAA